MAGPEFKPGFRISATDVLVLILGSISSAFAWQRTWWIGFVIAFVVGHFFLFCNIFRIARSLELVWAVVFVLLTKCTLSWGQPSWTMTVILSLVTTLTVVAVEMKKPSYHGVGWQWANPRLGEWWKTHVDRSE